MKSVVESLQGYKDKNILLEKFKTALNNEHKLYRNQVEQVPPLSPDEGPSRWHQEDYQQDYEQVPPDLVVEVFNELGIDSDRLQLHEGYWSEDDINYYYYSYSEFWDLINGQEPFNFLVAMATINLSRSRLKSIVDLQGLIKRTMLNGDIKVTNNEKTVFVAMSFSPEAEGIKETIEKVVWEFGFTAILINLKEHNAQIVPEIFHEIDKSLFVIADLTEHKNGVYFEAGYAIGRGKDVILTCNEKDFETRHFDVAQINTIKWSTFEGLEVGLRKRIESNQLVT